MNQDQGLSALRWLLSIAGSYVLASGKIDGVMWAQISTAILTVFPVVWSMFVHTDASKVQAASTVVGVQPIQIAADAPPALQALANNTNVPGVQPVSPYTAPAYPSATQKR